MINRPYIIFYQRSIYIHCSLLYRGRPLLRDFREATPGDVLRLYVSRRFKFLQPHPCCSVFYIYDECFFLPRLTIRREYARTKSNSFKNAWKLLCANTVRKYFRYSRRKCEREKTYIRRRRATERCSFPDIAHAGDFNGGPFKTSEQ